MDPGALMALARHGEAIATARAFAARAGAQRVVLLLDDDGETAMVEVGADGAAEVTERDETVWIPAEAEAPAMPRALPDIRPVPPAAINIDVTTGQLAAPLGTVSHLAESVLALAASFGGLTVATAEFATRDPELPITFAAREGEPVVLEAGDAQYQL